MECVHLLDQQDNYDATDAVSAISRWGYVEQPYPRGQAVHVEQHTPCVEQAGTAKYCCPFDQTSAPLKRMKPQLSGAPCERNQDQHGNVASMQCGKWSNHPAFSGIFSGERTHQ